MDDDEKSALGLMLGTTKKEKKNVNTGRYLRSIYVCVREREREKRIWRFLRIVCGQWGGGGGGNGANYTMRGLKRWGLVVVGIYAPITGIVYGIHIYMCVTNVKFCDA